MGDLTTAQLISTGVILGVNLLFAMIGVWLVRLTLYWFDTSPIGRTFLTTVSSWSDHAQAVYFGARFIGVCLVVGLALS